MKAFEQASCTSGSGSESQGKITVYSPCNDSGVIKAYDRHGNIVLSVNSDASGITVLNKVLPAEDYRLIYFTDPLGESGQVYEGILTVIP